jgi:cytoskeletal protein RodZ
MAKLSAAFRLLLMVSVLLITAHRLPAPIVEEEKPTPAAEQSAKPKPKPTIKPKATRENSESATRRQTSSPPPKTQPTQQNRFSGTWNGIINCGPGGDIEHTIAIDTAHNLVTVWQTKNPPNEGAALHRLREIRLYSPTDHGELGQ